MTSTKKCALAALTEICSVSFHRPTSASSPVSLDALNCVSSANGTFRTQPLVASAGTSSVFAPLAIESAYGRVLPLTLAPCARMSAYGERCDVALAKSSTKSFIDFPFTSPVVSSCRAIAAAALRPLSSSRRSWSHSLSCGAMSSVDAFSMLSSRSSERLKNASRFSTGSFAETLWRVMKMR